ncbi:transglutaminase-like domain-containing protein [Frigoribacterium sp. MEB024]|uniref:transglutaminase-like domain-containing protein n=1 Tax=Frigoribacterium sp. MEB024 TaxID=1589899 RepID=UPI000696D066|nr:transglutaminase-like domain-containing protein [Frigoribacterium sp. MEB024]
MTAVDEVRTPVGPVTPPPRVRSRTRPSRLRAPFVSSVVALFAASLGTATATFWPVYESAAFVVLVLVAFAVGVVIALGSAVLRLSSVWVFVATVVAYLLLGVPLAVPSQALVGVLPTGRGLLTLVSATALGWKQLVTIALPVGSYEALLVPVFALVLVGTVVGISVALRSRRGEVAVVVPVVVWITAIVLGPGDPWWPRATGLAVLVTVVAWVVWWRLRRRRVALDALSARAAPRSAGHRPVAVRAVVGTLVTLVVAATAGTVAVSAIPPATSRTVARTVVEQPFDPRDHVSPLSGFRAYEQEPMVDQTLLTVSGLRDGQRLRVATLDTYDGVVYSVGSGEVDSASGFFTRVPSEVDQSEVDGDATSVDVTVGAYDDLWLPTVGRLESVSFDGATADARRDAFFYNDVTGTAAVLGGIRQGDSYRLDAVEPRQPGDDELDALTPGTATVPTPRDVPDELSSSLEEDVAGVQGPGARLRAALGALREDGYVSHGVTADEPVSRSGHGADRIAQLFTDPVMIGDAEQYATAAALMADQLGFPARVVMGFAPEADGGSVEVTGSNVSAWIEVDTAQYGWVALDPNPAERPIPEDQVQDPTQISRPESVVQPPPLDPQMRDDQTPPQSEQDDPEDPPAWLAVVLAIVRVVGWSALVAGLLAAPFVTIVALKARRRRRRRTATSPSARISGGWHEFQDAVVDHGIRTPPAATRSEVAAVVGGSRPAVLARVADRAVFSPNPPAESDADRVWTAVAEMRRALGVGLTRRQRFAAAVSLRSMRGYHGRTPPERQRND